MTSLAITIMKQAIATKMPISTTHTTPMVAGAVRVSVLPVRDW